MNNIIKIIWLFIGILIIVEWIWTVTLGITYSIDGIQHIFKVI